MQHYLYIMYMVGGFYFKSMYYNLVITIYVILPDNSIEIKMSY